MINEFRLLTRCNDTYKEIGMGPAEISRLQNFMWHLTNNI